MPTPQSLLTAATAVAVMLVHTAGPLRAQTEGAAALSGQVSSEAEGPMEGVLVSARKRGATITTTVVSDRDGRYRFPPARLSPGQYDLAIRATGYELDSDPAMVIAAGKMSTADLKLRTTDDLASQLSNSEWLASIPGTAAQKSSVRRCSHCHLMHRVMTSRFDAETWVPVLERMRAYPPLAFPLMPQMRPAERIGSGPIDYARRDAENREQAKYLASINLSRAPERGYPLEVFPRPTGKATQVIYTTYDLSPATRQPHDVIVDSAGFAWYASFGEQVLAKLDPDTGKLTEYQIPTLKPESPTGILGVAFDRDENVWMALQFQGGVARFDRKTETFQTWRLPEEIDGAYVQIVQLSPRNSHVDNKVWMVDAGTHTVLRLDFVTGEFEVFAPFEIPRPGIYTVLSDTENNAFFTVIGAEHIGTINARSGEITLFETPTHGSAPRRGWVDKEGLFWFAENRGNKIGMFDPTTRKFREWEVPTPYSFPYDVTRDKNGDVWAGGEYSDRVARLDPATGEFIEYALPGFVNIRRVFVDNRKTPVQFWVGANHSASIIRLEPF